MLTKLTIVTAVAILALTRPILGEGPAAKLDVARVPTLIERGAPAATPTEHHLTFSAKFIQRHDETEQQDKPAIVKDKTGTGGRSPPTRGHPDAAHRERGGRATASKLKILPRADEADGQGCAAAAPGSVGRRSSARFVQMRRGPGRSALDGGNQDPG
ncbi:hypothetical protein M0657_002723 [Pyricularia oryzae]|nr:hypothetical protein M9X92_002603 [Pyricularia oryzae]KAI7928324.1 hypothetical protein M0657_002723 [Pyricularia oryzae]